jgi:hypothetical protein
MCDSHYKSHKETPPNPPHKNPKKRAPKIPPKKKKLRNK